jgi:hypothetical protein
MNPIFFFFDSLISLLQFYLDTDTLFTDSTFSSSNSSDPFLTSARKYHSQTLNFIFNFFLSLLFKIAVFFTLLLRLFHPL